MTTISVIIPYYQTESGILSHALDSIRQQRLPPNAVVNIIVVDDGSPIPSELEVWGDNFISPFKLSIIKQPNAGVISARNAGLSKIGEETDFIAFLDSDDEWNSEHLTTALSALDLGYDFYFCDHRRGGHHDSYLATIPFSSLSKFTESLGIDENIYKIEKAPFFDFFLRNFVSQISTVVYRRSIAPEISFNAALSAVGEDYLFLLQIVLKANRISYSSGNLVTCGGGVNIYAGKYSWDNSGHLVRYMGEILRLYGFQKHLQLSSDNAIYVSKCIDFYRKCFSYLTTRFFLKKRELWPKELIKLTRNDSKFWLWYPVYVPYTIALYCLGLFHPNKSLPVDQE